MREAIAANEKRTLTSGYWADHTDTAVVETQLQIGTGSCA
jgi:hypothetical protein